MKKKKTIMHPLTYEFSMKQVAEKGGGASLTVPGEAYSVPELMAKVKAGIPINAIINVAEEQYSDTNEDWETPAFDHEPDKTDINRMAVEASDIIEAAKTIQKEKSEAAPTAKESDVGATPSEEGQSTTKTQIVEKTTPNEAND